MVFYFQRRVESARAGGHIAGVKCDKCGCEYFYELTRIGSGSGTAPFGIGNATRSAKEQSQEDLSKRLAVEAELVPCPECHWINDDLVEGYRLGRYRRVGMLALGVAFFGTFGSLLCAWFISTGPPADHDLLPYFLFGGPILSVSIATFMVLFRNWRRSRIQPNRDFPLSPALPAGSPPALIKDAYSGELRPAAPDQPGPGTTNGWVDFQVGRHSLPSSCCRCLQDADAEHALTLPGVGPINLEVPRCANCDRTTRRTYRRIWLITAVLGLLAGAAVIALLKLESAEFWILAGVSLLLSCTLASFVASTMTAPVKVASGDESRGVVRLQFRNADYARLVAAHIDDPGTPVD